MRELEKYNLRLKFPVLWGQMDAANHVNNLEYMRWAETGRIEYFNKMGMDISFSGKDIGPIMGWQDCKYIFPVTYPDNVIIGIKTIEVKVDRFIMQCAIFSDKHQRLVAISKQSIIPYSYKELKKMPLPESWLAQIKEMES